MHGLASALVVVARMIGMLVGISILTAVSLHIFYTTAVGVSVAGGALPPGAAQLPRIRADVTTAIVNELRAVFLGAGICAGLAAVLAAGLLRGRPGDWCRQPHERDDPRGPPGVAGARGSARGDRGRGRSLDVEAYLVGGFVRDRLLGGAQGNDIDLVTVGVDPMPLLARRGFGCSAGIRPSGSSGSGPRRSAGGA